MVLAGGLFQEPRRGLTDGQLEAQKVESCSLIQAEEEKSKTNQMKMGEVKRWEVWLGEGLMACA